MSLRDITKPARRSCTSVAATAGSSLPDDFASMSANTTQALSEAAVETPKARALDMRSRAAAWLLSLLADYKPRTCSSDSRSSLWPKSARARRQRPGVRAAGVRGFVAGCHELFRPQRLRQAPGPRRKPGPLTAAIRLLRMGSGCASGLEGARTSCWLKAPARAFTQLLGRERSFLSAGDAGLPE